MIPGIVIWTSPTRVGTLVWIASGKGHWQEMTKIINDTGYYWLYIIYIACLLLDIILVLLYLISWLPLWFYIDSCLLLIACLHVLSTWHTSRYLFTLFLILLFEGNSGCMYSGDGDMRYKLYLLGFPCSDYLLDVLISWICKLSSYN